MSLFAVVKNMPYETSETCQSALLGTEAIDYFFARQIISRQQSSTNPCLTLLETEEVFHVLVALSYLQRQGSVCVSLSKIAGQSLWRDLSGQAAVRDSQNTLPLEELDNSTNVNGYCFSERTIISQILCKFIHGLPFNTFLILEDDRLYSKRYWQYEQNLCHFIAKSLSEINLHNWQASINGKQSEVTNIMQLMFSSLAVENKQADLQQLSVLNALLSPFSIITGGAGTGKTYTITRLAVLLCVIRGISVNNIEMAAPTGKAANRLAQSLQNELLTLKATPELSSICDELSKVEPKTISRLLKINPANGKSAYDKQRPLAAKLVIIDETSMIDISLMNKLINSLSDNTQLVLVGDPNQLPSVETGCLLADLVDHPIAVLSPQRWELLRRLYPPLDSADEYVSQVLVKSQKYGKSAVNRLSQMRRSSNEIAEFAKAVLSSNSEKALLLAENSRPSAAICIKPFINKTIGKTFESARDIQAILSKDIIDNFSALFDAKSVEQAFEAMKKYALLTPFRQSIYGTYSLNQVIEAQLSRRYEWVVPDTLYRCKPIMILQNDYQLSLFNGDLGLIWEGEDKQKFAYFKTAKGLMKYSIYNLPVFEVNFAMTIHKTQGSEFDAVDIILPSIESDFLNRQLLYTGITRAKLNVRLFTNSATLTQMIKRSADRVSGIDKNLSKAIDLLD